MKKFLSIFIVLIFVFAAFFVFATEGYSLSPDPAALPVFTYLPIFTTFDMIVNIPDPNLRAALHTATGVPPANDIYRSDLSALSGTLSLSGKHIANAQGVQYCSNVEYLFLDANDLSSLPANMSPLTSLRFISLSENDFTSLPGALYSISSLESITIRNNPITSVDPGIGFLTLLRTLDLWDCKLTSFPTEIISTNIEQLVISGNNIGSLPPQIFNMNTLKRLYANDTGLSSLPDTLFDMVWLDALSVADNNLSSLSSDIGNLATLNSLDVSGNKLEHLPSEVCDITSLQYLVANDNRLYDLPVGIGSTNIEELSVNSNRIKSLPSSLVNNTSLYLLDVMVNRLKELPTNFGAMTIDFCNLEFNFMDVSPGTAARTIIDSGALGTVDYERQLPPVSNLVAAPTDTEIALSWDACPDGADGGSTWEVEGYIVYLHDSGLDELAELGRAELAYTHTGLGTLEPHEYWVGVNYRVVHPARAIDTSIRGYTVITTATLAESAASPSASVSTAPMASGDSAATESGAPVEDTVTANTESVGVALKQQDNSFPVWAIIVLSIIGGAALAAGIFFGVKALKNRPKKPNDDPPSRSTEL